MSRFALLAVLAGALFVNGAVAEDKPNVELGPNANLGGVRLLPDDSPWHEDISGVAVDPRSEAILARIGLDKPLHADFGDEWEGVPIGIPYVVVGDDQENSRSRSNTPKKAIQDLIRSRRMPRSRAARTATGTGTC